MAAGRRSGRPGSATVVGAAIVCIALTNCVVTVGSAPQPSPAESSSVATSVSAPPSVRAGTPSPAPASPGAPAHDPATCTTALSRYPIASHRSGGLTAADERVVVAGLRLARRTFDVRVPGCTRGEVTVEVLDREHDRFAAGTFVQDVPNFKIEVYAGGPSWQRMPRSQVPILMLHEWYHVVQASFLRCDPPRCREQRRPVPAWLIEGSAEYAAAQAAQDEQLFFYRFIRRSQLTRAGQVETPLQRLEEARTSGDYGLSFAAVELLVGDAGERALLRFWKRAGSTGRWGGAFTEAFGTTTRRFYVEFAAYRARGFRR